VAGTVEGPSRNYLQVAQARPGEAGGGLASFLPEDMEPPVAVPNQNAVLARGTVEALDKFAELLAQLDVPIKQINTQVDLVDNRTTDVAQAGVDFHLADGSAAGNVFAQPAGGQSFLAYATGAMSALASAGLRSNSSTTVDSANVTTQSGSPAAITVGKVTPFFAPMVTYNMFGQRIVDYQVGAIFSGIELWVLPRALPNDMINVLLRATFIDTVGAVTSPTGTQIPITESVSKVAQLTIKSGQTVCIGGLSRVNDSQSQFVAGLGQVTQRERTTALLYVTPKIVRQLDTTEGQE
jgi:type II secretory pathway component GspD/PulD (secretin)